MIGQPSFSAREAGINATALSISTGRLYVADTANHLLAFDLSKLAASGSSPSAILNQSVMVGISAVSVYGKSVAIADTVNHRVLVWRDASSESALKGPDVVLADSSSVVEPISVALDKQRLFVGDAALHRVLVWNTLPQSNNQAADVVLGQPNFAASSVSDVPAANTVARPVALESDGERLFVADSTYRRILVFAAADIPLPLNPVVNSASLTPAPLAPGALVTISAAGLTQASDAALDGADEPLPKKLGGVEVILDGSALPLLSVSPTEIHAQFPYDIINRSSSSLFIRSEQEKGAVVTSNAVAVSLIPASPGLFAFSGKEPRPGMALHGTSPVTANNPAHPGDAITLWGAGLGAVIAAEASESGAVAGVPNAQPDSLVQVPVTATVNGMPGEVLSAVIPQGSIGIYEVRILLPRDFSVEGSATLAISQDGHQSNTITIPVKNGTQ